MVGIFFCKYTQTYRAGPENYWLASVKDNKLVFDSWDGMAKPLLTPEVVASIKRNFLYRKYGAVIQDVINNYGFKYPVITMHHPLIKWAYKKGYVSVQSATQQGFTEAGFKFFFRDHLPTTKNFPKP